MSAAAEIVQAHLDRVSAAIWDRDFDAVADAMRYPHKLATRDAILDVTDRETLITAARGFRDSLERLGATAYHRVCIAASVAGEDENRINGLHRVYILRGGNYVLDPYRSEMVLIREGGTWLGAGIQSEVRNRDVTLVNVDPDLFRQDYD